MRKKLEGLLVYLLMGISKRYWNTVSRIAKIKAVVLYLKAVKGARLAFIATLATIACVFLLIAGFIMIHVGLFLYLPWTTAEKGVALLICGLVYFLLALGLLLFATSEKFWMKYSKAGEMVRKATETNRD